MDNFDTLIETINKTDIVYYLNISIVSDNSQDSHKIEFMYHNIDNFRRQTTIQLFSYDTTWIEVSNKGILNSLDDKKYFLRFLDNDLADISLLILFLSFYFAKNQTMLTVFNNISDGLSFMIIFGTAFYIYRITIMLCVPIFKVKWKSPPRKIIKYLLDKISDSVISHIITLIIGGGIAFIISRLPF